MAFLLSGNNHTLPWRARGVTSFVFPVGAEATVLPKVNSLIINYIVSLLEKYKELTKGCGFYTIFMKNYSVYVIQNIKTNYEY